MNPRRNNNRANHDLDGAKTEPSRAVQAIREFYINPSISTLLTAIIEASQDAELVRQLKFPLDQQMEHFMRHFLRLPDNDVLSRSVQVNAVALLAHCAKFCGTRIRSWCMLMRMGAEGASAFLASIGRDRNDENHNSPFDCMMQPNKFTILSNEKRLMEKLNWHPVQLNWHPNWATDARWQNIVDLNDDSKGTYKLFTYYMDPDTNMLMPDIPYHVRKRNAQRYQAAIAKIEISAAAMQRHAKPAEDSDYSDMSEPMSGQRIINRMKVSDVSSESDTPDELRALRSQISEQQSSGDSEDDNKSQSSEDSNEVKDSKSESSDNELNHSKTRLNKTKAFSVPISSKYFDDGRDYGSGSSSDSAPPVKRRAIRLSSSQSESELKSEIHSSDASDLCLKRKPQRIPSSSSGNSDDSDLPIKRKPMKTPPESDSESSADESIAEEQCIKTRPITQRRGTIGDPDDNPESPINPYVRPREHTAAVQNLRHKQQTQGVRELKFNSHKSGKCTFQKKVAQLAEAPVEEETLGPMPAISTQEYLEGRLLILQRSLEKPCSSELANKMRLEMVEIHRRLLNMQPDSEPSDLDVEPELVTSSPLSDTLENMILNVSRRRAAVRRMARNQAANGGARMSSLDESSRKVSKRRLSNIEEESDSPFNFKPVKFAQMPEKRRCDESSQVHARPKTPDDKRNIQEFERYPSALNETMANIQASIAKVKSDLSATQCQLRTQLLTIQRRLEEPCTSKVASKLREELHVVCGKLRELDSSRASNVRRNSSDMDLDLSLSDDDHDAKMFDQSVQLVTRVSQNDEQNESGFLESTRLDQSLVSTEHNVEPTRNQSNEFNPRAATNFPDGADSGIASADVSVQLAAPQSPSPASVVFPVPGTVTEEFVKTWRRCVIQMVRQQRGVGEEMDVEIERELEELEKQELLEMQQAEAMEIDQDGQTLERSATSAGQNKEDNEVDEEQEEEEEEDGDDVEEQGEHKRKEENEKKGDKEEHNKKNGEPPEESKPTVHPDIDLEKLKQIIELVCEQHGGEATLADILADMPHFELGQYLLASLALAQEQRATINKTGVDGEPLTTDQVAIKLIPKALN